MELENFPIIAEGDNRYYGGDQAWYRNKFHAEAGCGPTSGANLAAFYGMELKPITPGGCLFEKEAFINLMDVMYTYMTPGMMGFPYYQKYINCFLKFSEERKHSFCAYSMRSWKMVSEPVSFVKQAINSGNPVPFIILLHAEKALENNQWHWMTITGYGEDGESIILSNNGKREVYDSQILFSVHPHNKMRLIYFMRKNAENPN